MASARLAHRNPTGRIVCSSVTPRNHRKSQERNYAEPEPLDGGLTEYRPERIGAQSGFAYDDTRRGTSDVTPLRASRTRSPRLFRLGARHRSSRVGGCTSAQDGAGRTALTARHLPGTSAPRARRYGCPVRLHSCTQPVRRCLNQPGQCDAAIFHRYLGYASVVLPYGGNYASAIPRNLPL